MTHTPDELRAIAEADLIERAPVMVWLRFWKSHLPAKAVRQLQELAPVASLDRLAALEAERAAGEARVVDTEHQRAVKAIAEPAKAAFRAALAKQEPGS